MPWTNPKTWSVGETLTAANFNTHIRDNFNASAPHLVVRKGSDESVVSSIALQDDNDLLLNVAANEVWLFVYRLRYDADLTGSLKVSWGLPASGRVDAYAMTRDTSGATTSRFVNLTATDGSSFSVQGGGAGAFRGLTIEGWFVNGGTAGNYTLRWAQDTSNATATIMKTHSTLWAAKLV